MDKPKRKAKSPHKLVGSIGVISTGFPGNALLHVPYSISLLKGILQTADERQYNVTLFTQPWIDGDQLRRRFYETPVDGVVALAPDVDTDLIAAIRELGVPIVATSGNSGDLGIPAIDADDARGAELATGHLIELGHKRIAHLAGTMTQRDALTRRDTFLRVLGENGIDVPAGFVPQTGFDALSAYDDATQLLTRPDRPTGIFAASDYIAYWVIHAARDLGIDVPAKLSVVGYDDAPISLESSPSITTIRQPLEDMGRRAASLLLDLIAGITPVDETRLLPAELVVRASTGPAPSSA